MKPSNPKKIFTNEKLALQDAELILLIDEFTFPALLYDPESKHIYCGNSHFIELSGMGNPELIHHSLDQLLSGGENALQIENRPYPLMLKTKAGALVSITGQIKNLSRKIGVSLLKLSLGGDKYESDVELELFEIINSIFADSVNGDVLNVLNTVSNEARNLFGDFPNAIYILEENMLTRQTSNELFPKKLPLSELDRINNLDLWFPGKRILCEIHRIGRKGGLSGLFTAPLISEKSRGLFISGIQSKNYFQDNQKRFEIFTKWVNQLFGLAIKISKISIEIEALIQQVSQLQKFPDLSKDLMLFLDSDDRIQYVSKSFLNLTGYSSFELLQKEIHDFLNEKALKSVLSPPIEERQMGWQDINLFDRDGKKYSMALIVDSVVTGNDINKILVFNDKTRIIDLERSITRMEKNASLGESIADFAHDARNPLNNISTGLQMLRKLYAQNEPLVEAVDRMQSDCIRMSDLLESVLAFSRQNSEGFTPIDLDALVKSVFRKFENKFSKASVRTSYSNTLASAIINGDLRSLERVFINLINNAIESMESTGGELALLLKRNPKNDAEIEVSIADTGPGIPKEILEKIFEPYVTGKKTGTGLGLAIIKKIIDAHQGRIAIESFTSGTIFRIFLKEFMEDKS